jgi:hypothetical protein
MREPCLVEFPVPVLSKDRRGLQTTDGAAASAAD